MTEYRITKYNPLNRVNGVYTVDEWTSIGDIGKVFCGEELTLDAYLKTEQAYIDSVIEIMEKARITSLSTEDAEYMGENVCYPSVVSTTEDIREVISSCLREQCWLKLATNDFFIHFGYDYHMYVGTVLPGEIVSEAATKHGLYCELHPSPYNKG